MFMYVYCLYSVIQAGATALNYAAGMGQKECLKLLVHEYNADPEEVDIVS